MIRCWPAAWARQLTEIIPAEAEAQAAGQHLIKDLVLAFYDSANGKWEPLKDNIVHPDTNTITGKVSHFTLIGVAFFETAHGYGFLPITGARSCRAYRSTLKKCVRVLAAESRPIPEGSRPSGRRQVLIRAKEISRP